MSAPFAKPRGARDAVRDRCAGSGRPGTRTRWRTDPAPGVSGRAGRAWPRARVGDGVSEGIEGLDPDRNGLDGSNTSLQPAGTARPLVVTTLQVQAGMSRPRDELRPLLGKVRNAMVRGVETVLHLTSAVPGEGVSTIAREIVCAASTIPHCRPLLLDFNQGAGGQGAALGGALPGVIGSYMARGLVEVAAVSARGGTFHAAEFDVTSFDAFTPYAGGAHAEDAAGGRGGPEAGEPKTLAQLYRSLCRAYNLVVVDCPPVQDAPYFVPLAHDTPDVVLVVRAERTRIPVVLRAKDDIPALGGRLVGVIMNGRRSYVPGFIARRL